MEAQLISNGLQNSTLPQCYVRPEPDRPRTCESAEYQNTPIIDLGCGNRQFTVQQIAAACNNYGFFQVINHGVAKETTEKMLEVAGEFFGLPMEEKMKLYSNDPSKTTRLSTSSNPQKEKIHNWRDYLRLHCYPLEKYANEWPSNPSSFKDTLSKYCTEICGLGLRLQETISEGLGVDKDHINNSLGEQGQHMAINYYPQCPEPELTYGLLAHTDPIITITKLREEVKRYAAYHLESERQHDFTKKKLEKSQDTVGRFIQKEKQYNKAIYRLEVKVEELELEKGVNHSTIQELHKQVETLNDHNNDLLDNYINQLQNDMINVEDLMGELEWNPVEEEAEEAIGDGEVLDD